MCSVYAVDYQACFYWMPPLPLGLWRRLHTKIKDILFLFRRNNTFPSLSLLKNKHLFPSSRFMTFFFFFTNPYTLLLYLPIISVILLFSSHYKSNDPEPRNQYQCHISKRDKVIEWAPFPSQAGCVTPGTQCASISFTRGQHSLPRYSNLPPQWTGPWLCPSAFELGAELEGI